MGAFNNWALCSSRSCITMLPLGRRAWLLLLSCLALVQADVYLHSPRGSNNRLNEATANRDKNNRLFDSQNNARGGYNVGDSIITESTSEDEQYNMKYFQSGSGGEENASYMHVEWTNQHGCTGLEGAGENTPHKSNCNLVLQYMCQEDPENADLDTIRNGATTGRPKYGNRPSRSRGDFDETEEEYEARKAANVDTTRGLHEGFAWYDKCRERHRNGGLFIADRNVRDFAIHTRQNNGGRNGYECAEERDYYPYWHPSPWRDAAVFSGSAEYCDDYSEQSYNVQPYHECLRFFDSGVRKPYVNSNNEQDCLSEGGAWTLLYNFLEKAPEYTSEDECVSASTSDVSYVWALPHDTTDGVTQECLVQPPPVDCQPAQYQRVNSLGSALDGEMPSYQWKIPYFPSGKQQRCVVRMRYNISTADELQTLTNNPTVEAAGIPDLQLAINTAQFGRVFQDRSHVLLFAPRPTNMASGRLFNLNVRGKRGNLQETSPVVEYDFTPNVLAVRPTDMVHIQWTGSNTNNENVAGQGEAGTDRHNFLQLADLDGNYPMETPHMFDGAQIMWTYHGHEDLLSAEDVAVSMASSGYYMCKDSGSSSCPHPEEAVDTKEPMQGQLNNASPSYAGMVLKFTQGIYNYMCTRNNAFTNRSQKGTLVVADAYWANGAFPYWEHHEEAAEFDWEEFLANQGEDYSDWENLGWEAFRSDTSKLKTLMNLLRIEKK